jgi:Ser/Thr protein kinase RdoA (MazF antagonist)
MPDRALHGFVLQNWCRIILRIIIMEQSPGQALCNEFGLGTLRNVRSAGGTRNVNYIVATEAYTWFVRKRFTGYSGTEQLEFDHHVINSLADGGAAVLKPCRAKNGKTWWDDNEATWEVFPFIKARHLRDGDKADAAALGRALAGFHKAGSGITVRYAKGGVRGETDPAFLAQRAATIENESPETGEILASYLEVLAQAGSLFPDSSYNALPHTLIHGDVQPANVMFGAHGEVATFVDLDWCAWRPRLYDLSFALLFACAGHAEPFDGGDINSLTQTPLLEQETLEVFLKAYENTGQPLMTEERQLLRPQLLLAWCHTRISGALKVSPEERAAFLSRQPDLRNGDWLPL